MVTPESRHQSNIFELMQTPDFYPHPVQSVELRETHISMVFLTGDFVYKIKKPVDMDFLDFTTLEKRRYFCEQEVKLNRRLTQNVYLGVVAITHENGRYHFQGSGDAVEYAVKMRRLPDTASMLALLKNNELDRSTATDLARVLSRFYRNARTDNAISAFGSWSTIKTNCEENFSQMEEFAGEVIDQRIYQIIRAATRHFLQRRKTLFDLRVEESKIRDGHGDLRTGHIYFTADGIQIIDCIEFNQRFRCNDIASDLAFLAMDLDCEGRAPFARQLLKDYIQRTGDRDIMVLLDFYKCYRALVRAKVNCFRLKQGGLTAEEERRLHREVKLYVNLAYEYAKLFSRPTIWVVCGMIASGKSTVAGALADALQTRILRSDVIRKELFQQPKFKSQDAAFGEGMYTQDATSLTYGKLLLKAQETIENGDSIILDATFSREFQRRDVWRLAVDMDANIIFIECRCREEVIVQRLKKRPLNGSVSDARLKHLNAFKERYEAFDENHNAILFPVDTEKPLKEIMADILPQVA